MLWLVRHGHVDAPHGSYGDTDVSLSAVGREETRAAVESLAALEDLRAIWSSPLLRARAMGEGLARATGLALHVEDGLKEAHRGRWQGLDMDEYRARWDAEAEAYWEDPSSWRGHGGESEADLIARGLPCVEAAARAAAGGVAAVTAHRQIIRAVVAAAVGIPPVASHRMLIATGSGVLLEDAPHGWVLHRTSVKPPAARQAAELESGPPEDVAFGPVGSDVGRAPGRDRRGER
ncbi:MAG: histidine phosphatase family protein [Planctomycetota bacterium]|nr:histidine phosphatase family protein [Planctomycetota bacterium]